MIESSGQRILVTGADGFVGRNLSSCLEERGNTVVRFDRVLDPADDITNRDAVVRALDGCDMAYNLAARLGTEQTTDGVSFVANNVLGATNLFEEATQRGIPVVHASKPNPWNNFYSATKAAAEGVAHVYNAERGGQIKIVRMFNLYGPGQHHGSEHPEKFGPTFVHNALRGEPLHIYGSGEQECDFTYVDDAVEGMLRVADHPHLKDAVEIGTGEPISVNAVAQLIIALANSSSEIVHVPMRPGEPDEKTTVVADTTRMHELLNYHPSTPLVEGLEKTIHFYRNS